MARRRRYGVMEKIEVGEVVAILLIIGCFIGIYLGYDAYLMTLLGTIAGYYFGHRRIHE